MSNNYEFMTEGELIALWPSDFRLARQVLAGVEGVLEVQTFGDQLRVFARDGDAAVALVVRALESKGIEILDIRRTRPRMEEAFIAIIQRRMGENEGQSEKSAAFDSLL